MKNTAFTVDFQFAFTVRLSTEMLSLEMCTRIRNMYTDLI